MRWDHLRLVEGDGDGAAGPAPPLIERGAVARTFDTPGFRGMTFYEIHARTIINRVPEASRVPFRWTINPYRGCSHACSYCLDGDTPVLAADGRTVPLRDLRPGDAIYGTGPGRRRLVVTRVLDHWRTRKPAYRVRLGDGTALTASADHRFLTGRGWCHVAAHTGEAAPSPAAGDRPVLRPGDVLIGMGGGFAEPPKHDDDYRRGYLHALAQAAPPEFRALECAARRRARRFLGEPPAQDAGLPGGAWPAPAPEGWLKGFLAGCWDAGLELEGGPRPGSPLAARAGEALRWLGLTGAARLRLLHVLDPACTHGAAGALEGTRVRAAEGTRVVSVQAVGLEADLYDITTGTGDFIAGGVVSHNCFARKTHEYLDLDSGADFDSKIVVKVNAAERVRRELAAPRWRGEHIAMGTNVDCYQRAEGRYRLMPGILEALRDAANPFSILTKGALILRDLPLLLEAAERTEVSTAVSAAFVDRDLWRLVEPGTPAPGRRLEVCAALNEAGIGCAVLMGPVLPYLTDTPAQLEAAVKRIAEAGATSVTPITLHLRPGAREWYLSWLREHYPELIVPYARLYARGAYAPRAYQDRIAAQVRELAAKYGVGRSSRHRGTRRRTGSQAPAAARTPPRPVPEQLTLPT
ncbi:radical SAM protein [Actinomadura sp. NBRC 104412]|uniref:intein-containing Rv2578c family radical SAM protein n=1 Tax=Actinomadura sp. NBRC 104412 TaxID=3032203 RepID=UPI0024A57843|nr:intein-containing Rv2578c family radical SAM protein [Actinomadura sp. NBRC 104412]GLZ03282.1 radical SAM protein [Actinomadura sp. NBRC 104412]